jgi:hypothetical protein
MAEDLLIAGLGVDEADTNAPEEDTRRTSGATRPEMKTPMP